MILRSLIINIELQDILGFMNVRVFLLREDHILARPRAGHYYRASQARQQ